MMILLFGREDVTRTRDPYVPNVVRYQLRHFSFASANDIRSLSAHSNSLNSSLIFKVVLTRYFQNQSPICERSRFLCFFQKSVQRYCFFFKRANYFLFFRRKVAFSFFFATFLPFSINSNTSFSVNLVASMFFGM